MEAATYSDGVSEAVRVQREDFEEDHSEGRLPSELVRHERVHPEVAVEGETDIRFVCDYLACRHAQLWALRCLCQES